MATDTIDQLCVQYLLEDPPLDDYPDQGNIPKPRAGANSVSSLALPSNQTAAAAAEPPLPDHGPVELALRRNAFWTPGRTLRVYFMDGTPALQQKVMTWAKEWEVLANITVVQVTDDNAEIRVTIDEATGYSSVVGTAALNVNPSDPTMNLKISNDTEVNRRRHTLHEFGHALGAVHEHESPGLVIHWNVQKVYDHYSLQGWSRDKVNRNVLHQYTPLDVKYTPFDADSVMLYSFSSDLTTDGFSTHYNTELSATDKHFIGLMYPWYRRSTGGFDTLEIHSRDQPSQNNTQLVSFTPQYPEGTVPQIAMALTSFECSDQFSVSVKSIPGSLTETGMSANIQAWTNTVLYRASANWLEFPGDDMYFQTGTYSTGEFSDLQKIAQLTYSRPFRANPVVVLFLNEIYNQIVSDDSILDCTLVGTSGTAGCTVCLSLVNVPIGSTWSAGISWLAYDPTHLPVGVAVYSSQLYTTAENIEQLTTPVAGHVTFPAGTFTKPPTLMLGFSGYYFFFNLDGRIRLSIEYTNVTKDGFDFSVDLQGPGGVKNRSLNNLLDLPYIAIGTNVPVTV